MKNDGDLALDAGRIRERWHTGKKGIVVVGGLLYVSSKMRGGTQVVWFSKLDALPDSGHRGGTGGEISRSGTENSGWLVGGPRGRRKAGLSLPFESSSAFVGHSDRASLALLSFVEAGCEKQDLGNEARRGGENEWLGGGGGSRRRLAMAAWRGRSIRRGGTRRPGGLLWVGRSPGPRLRNQQKSPNKTNPQQNGEKLKLLFIGSSSRPTRFSPSVHVSPHALSRNHASVSDAQECHFHRLIFETSHDCARNNPQGYQGSHKHTNQTFYNVANQVLANQ